MVISAAAWNGGNIDFNAIFSILFGSILFGSILFDFLGNFFVTQYIAPKNYQKTTLQ